PSICQLALLSSPPIEPEVGGFDAICLRTSDPIPLLHSWSRDLPGQVLPASDWSLIQSPCRQPSTAGDHFQFSDPYHSTAVVGRFYTRMSHPVGQNMAYCPIQSDKTWLTKRSTDKHPEEMDSIRGRNQIVIQQGK
ncbi:hypothetical protein BaRGS_00016229, partial [Batillaria attramentaria]